MRSLVGVIGVSVQYGTVTGHLNCLRNFIFLSILPLYLLCYFFKAASLALQSFPILNASVDEKLENITYKVILLVFLFLFKESIWWAFS